ncbi:hypothetical protein E1B28_005519 [Marasmius oreades]|uniref:Uncharacterized protein n=1 Tax=Marasmius oreades TaxID=181124 RepID=A0A9P7UUW8_9AGAR|nr:uncharacterized protein E1B28_005519 [Marasmius oreades]KAG7094700.1 hypothetical protein E1B28_005519 [Marasmius oreades]
MAGHEYAHPFGAAGHPSYLVQYPQSTLAVPPGLFQPNALAGPGIPSGYPMQHIPQAMTASVTPTPPPSNTIPLQPTIATLSMPSPPQVEAVPLTVQATLPHIEEVTGRPTKSEAQGLQESFAEMDSLLEKLAEQLGTTPDLLLSRYLANDSQGRIKGKDNPWNTYQQWVLNDDSILIQEMQRLEEESSEDMKWDGHSPPDARQLKLAFWRFKDDEEDWEEILREAKIKVLQTKQIQHYRRKAFESIFERIKSLLATADNRYGFSGVAMLIGNNVNEDQSLAHIHTTSKVETFAEDCCLTDRSGLIGHLRSLAYENARRQVLKSEIVAAAERFDLMLQSPTERPSNPGVASASTTSTAASSTAKDVPVNTTSQNSSSIVFSVRVPNYSSESKLTEAARMALRGRASDAGLNSEKLYWNTLHKHMTNAGLVIINWPHSVLQPWTISSSSSKGIAKLDKASRMALVAACDEHCRERLSFVPCQKTDIRNSNVPILSFTPDADGKIGEIFLKDIMSKPIRKHSKRKANIKLEADSDSLEGVDSDELDNSDEEVASAAPATNKEEETPTARPRSLRSTDHAKSQPPAAETATVKTRAKSQPPPKNLSSASVKKVSFQDPVITNEDSRFTKAPPVIVTNDVSISTNVPSNFTSLERLTNLRNNTANDKPAISMKDLDLVMTGKCPSPPSVDEANAKRPRYEDPTPAKNPLMVAASTHTSTSQSTPVASVQQTYSPAPPLSLKPPHFSPAPGDVSPEPVPPSHPQRHATPSLTITHPQSPALLPAAASVPLPPPLHPQCHSTPTIAQPPYLTHPTSFQNYPHHQPPQPQFSPEQVQAVMAMMAASGYQFPQSTGAANPFLARGQAAQPGGSVYPPHSNHFAPGHPMPNRYPVHPDAGSNYRHRGEVGQSPYQGGDAK